MLKFIRGEELAQEFQSLGMGGDRRDIAVAYWGRGAAAELKIHRGNCDRIICNLKSGACDPSEIEAIINNQINIRTHDKLHAKVYLANDAAIVGSTNASTNGLAMSDRFSAWREANVVVRDDSDILKDIKVWFEEIWNDSRSITAEDIAEAKELWLKRRKIVEDRKLLLFDAYEEDPDLFSSVYCIVFFQDDLDPGADKKRDQVKKNFPKSWWYQPKTPMIAGSWLIRCDFENEKKPKLAGHARVPRPVIRWKIEGRDEHDLFPVNGETAIRFGRRSYRLTNKEERVLLSGLKANSRVKAAARTKDDVVVPLRDVLRSR